MNKTTKDEALAAVLEYRQELIERHDAWTKLTRISNEELELLRLRAQHLMNLNNRIKDEPITISMVGLYFTEESRSPEETVTEFMRAVEENRKEQSQQSAELLTQARDQVAEAAQKSHDAHEDGAMESLLMNAQINIETVLEYLPETVA